MCAGTTPSRGQGPDRAVRHAIGWICTLRATFAHMSVVVEFWTALMAGQPVDAARDDRSLAALIDRHERAYGTFATLARRGRDEQRLDDTFPDPDGDATRMTFGSTIMHVILHNAQHRGEILHLLERLGAPELREGNPLDWELAPQGLQPISPVEPDHPWAPHHHRHRPLE